MARLWSGNTLLDSVSHADFSRVSRELTQYSIRAGVVIQHESTVVPYVYFVTGGLCSRVAVLKDKTADVGLVGREGMLGLGVWHGERRSSLRWVVHLDGEALRMPAQVFFDSSRPGQPLYGPLQRYAAAVTLATTRVAACNGLHSVEQRCARWLLTARARSGRSTMRIRHQILSDMLGVRRAGVSEVLKRFAELGIVRLGRAEMCILDPKRLQAHSCTCVAALLDCSSASGSRLGNRP